jgi:uncharacterized protein (DUF433 family)
MKLTPAREGSLRRDHGDMATDLLDLISSDPAVFHGRAVIRGTRVPVTVVIDCLADGMSENELREAHPTLPRGVVRWALAYASALARDEIVPLDPTPLAGRRRMSWSGSDQIKSALNQRLSR